jgi:hypothetical protein
MHSPDPGVSVDIPRAPRRQRKKYLYGIGAAAVFALVAVAVMGIGDHPLARRVMVTPGHFETFGVLSAISPARVPSDGAFASATPRLRNRGSRLWG